MFEAANKITKSFTADELVKMFNAITVHIGTVEPISEVLRDPMVKRRLLYAQDPISGKKITLALTPYMTKFLRSAITTFFFPPHLGNITKKYTAAYWAFRIRKSHR